MNLKLEVEFSKAELLQEVDALKKQIDDMRPLPEDVEGRVMQKLRLDWNYHSNAIEGNRLSYGETVAFLMEGITAKGKPLKDHLDIRGHNEAINFLLSIAKESRPISEADIRSLHKMILVEPYDTAAKTPEGLKTTKRISLGEYKTSANHVKTATGEMHYYATPEETPAKMQELMEWYGEAYKNSDIHPVVVAALFHHKFVSIHPFDDGNGRLSRILMNLILMQNGYQPVVIKMDDRQNYYALLSRADANDNWPFVEYISERLKSSLQLYLKAASGGDIDEDEDIDKEITLFKIGLKNMIQLKEKKSVNRVFDIITKEMYPLFRKTSNKANEFDKFFFSTSKFFSIDVLKDNKVTTEYIFFKDETMAIELPKGEYNYVKYYCSFKEFKNSNKDFSFINVWQINFDTYSYNITNIKKEKVISKYYYESLSKQEQQIIIKEFINELKLTILAHTKDTSN